MHNYASVVYVNLNVTSSVENRIKLMNLIEFIVLISYNVRLNKLLQCDMSVNTEIIHCMTIY